MKKHVNSPLRAINHPEDLKSVYITSGKGTRRSDECNCLVLSQCGYALGVCALTLALLDGLYVGIVCNGHFVHTGRC